MCKHKLGLAGNGRALMCLLPDCRTGGKPFVMAGGYSTSGNFKFDLAIAEMKIADKKNELKKLKDRRRGLVAIIKKIENRDLRTSKLD